MKRQMERLKLRRNGNGMNKQLLERKMTSGRTDGQKWRLIGEAIFLSSS